MPPPAGRDRKGYKSPLPWQHGNRRYAAIFLVTVLLLVGLYSWNRKQVDIENRDEAGRDRLCEVRAETGADMLDCEQD
ncbi:hypothetical protein BH23ACT12_BH23ACT12_03130 [soil metagenome]